ncbi:MAG: DUF1501 domain-containing protein [Gemmataceae bacterium]
MLHRRDFLKTSGLIGLGTAAPFFLTRTAFAAGNAAEPGKKDTVLVMLQLTGGNDGLNTVIPFKDELYEKYRPTLKVAKDQVKKVNDSLGLHPAMDAFAKLLEKQALCIVQGVGYPNPSQSHFRSMDIWQAASTAENLSEGWIGKALKSAKGPAFHVTATNEPAPLALAGAPVRAPSIASLDDFQLKTAAITGADQRQQKSLIEGAASGSSQSPGMLDVVKKTAESTYASSKRLQEIGKNYQPKSTYPQTGLANRLKLAAQLIDADLGSRVFYVTIDGFDTHSGQGAATGAHANLLREVSDAVSTFYLDLEARGHGERVLIATFSEFGRRAKENGSRGTDHGSAAPMFLVGGKVAAGVVGEHPSLDKLAMGNLKHAIDFRSVYAAILDGWLGVNAAEVLGSKFEPAKLFKV